MKKARRLLRSQGVRARQTFKGSEKYGKSSGKVLRKSETFRKKGDGGKGAKGVFA